MNKWYPIPPKNPVRMWGIVSETGEIICVNGINSEKYVKEICDLHNKLVTSNRSSEEIKQLRSASAKAGWKIRKAKEFHR